LVQFKRSEVFKSIPEYNAVNVLTEDSNDADRDFYIKKAACLGQVTLATRNFGRGTDFISHDGALEKLGGVHVLQAFFSLSLSEEIQIKGRTGRQGMSGSYSMVLLAKDMQSIVDSDGNLGCKEDTLEYFGLDYEENLKDRASTWYDILNAARLTKRQEEDERSRNLKEKSAKRYQLTQEYMEALHQRDTKKAIDNFRDMYNTIKGDPVRMKPIHVVLALDQSGSMEGDKFQELQNAYRGLVDQQKVDGDEGVVSVIMFDNTVDVLATRVNWDDAPNTLSLRKGGTKFAPVLNKMKELIDQSDQYSPVIVMLTDGDCGDIDAAKVVMKDIDDQFNDCGLQTHFVAFGVHEEHPAYQKLMVLQGQCTEGTAHVKLSNIGALQETFEEIRECVFIPEYN